MFLGEELHPIPKARAWPVLASIWLFALFTLAAGCYPHPFLKAVRSALARPPDGDQVIAAVPVPERALAAEHLPPAGP